MIAELKYNKNGWYCSKCRMIQKEINQQCEFCGANFTNYQNILIQINENTLDKSDEK